MSTQQPRGDGSGSPGESDRARQHAQRQAVMGLPFVAILMIILAVAPIIVGVRARVHRRLIADTIEPARIAAGDMEAALLHRLLTSDDTPPSPRSALTHAAPGARDAHQDTLEAAGRALGGEASRQIAAFEQALAVGRAASRTGARRADALRTEVATDSVRAWLDRRVAAERAAAIGIERWDVWLPMVLVPLCLLGVGAIGLASRQFMLLSRAAQRDAAALAEATRAKAALLRGVTHDLKNPLGAAYGYADLIADGVLGDPSEPVREAVQRVRQLLASTIETVDELTELARTESGSFTLSVGEVALDRLTAECVADNRAAAGANGLTLTDGTLVGNRHDFTIQTDGKRVRQILDNLVGNAIKYTPTGGVITVEASVDRARRKARITVSDTGPGIPHEMQSRIFDEFYRLEPHDADQRKDAPKGAGIGLAISRRMARMLRGDLSVAEAPSAGAAFSLTLPVS